MWGTSSTRSGGPRGARSTSLAAVPLVALVATALLAVVPAVAAAAPADGAFAWSPPWEYGTAGPSRVSLAPGPGASVFVAGTRFDQSGNDTAFARRLRAGDGTRIWRAAKAGMMVTAARSDSAGNLVVAGIAGRRIMLVKYRPDGSTAWTRTWGSSSEIQSVGAIAIGPDRSVLVAGLQSRDGARSDGLVLKYSPRGVLRWTYRDATSGADRAVAVAADGRGNVYVTGERRRTSTGSVWTTFKLRPSGSRAWVRNITFLDTFGRGTWLKLANGYLYVTGSRGQDPQRIVALKLTLNGAQRWMKSSDLPGSDQLQAATVDAGGRLVLAGRLTDPGTPAVDVAGMVVVLRPDGTRAWFDVFADPLGEFDTDYYGVAADGAGRVYCAGDMALGAAAPIDTDAVVVRYGASGGIEKQWRWDGLGAGTDTFGSLLLTAGAGLYAGGIESTPAGMKAVVQRLVP